MRLVHPNIGHNSIILLLQTVLLLSILILSDANSVCPSSAYVSASDVELYASEICATAVANTHYRIQGGASLSCSGTSPSVTSTDLNILTQALCIAITVTPGGSEIPVKMTLPSGCEVNYIQATYSQALAYQYEICATLNEWDIVSLQGGGSIRGRGYHCTITQTEIEPMGHIACVPLPVITATVTTVDANENVCSSCQSLIATSEASEYYASIPIGMTARIAGGSSIERTSESTFTILDHDPASRSTEICAPVPRAGCPINSHLTSSCTCEDLYQAKTSSVLPKITRALSKTTNIGLTIGAAFSGGPMALFTGLLFKQIGYIKYFDIAYPNNLELAFPKWQSDLIPSVFPMMSQNTKNKLEAKQIPEVFLKRKLAPTFLQNFWFSMLNLFISFFALSCIFLTTVYCKQKGKQNAEVILKYLLAGLVNFVIVQLYYYFGDILLFFILEARSIDFGSALSVFSFCISFVFLGIFLGALTLHSFIILKYSTARQNKKTMEFEEKYHHFKILIQAFKGSSFVPLSYLLLFVLRDVALNLIIALLFEHPLAQAILFLCICSAFISLLIKTRPFKRKIENIALCFFEGLVLFTYIFALIIRTNDWRTKDRLGMLIITMALIFSVVSTIFMLFTLVRMSFHFSQEQTKRKARRKIYIVPENSQVVQHNISLPNKDKAPPIKIPVILESDDSPQAIDVSPLTFNLSPAKSIIGLEKSETVPATESSCINDLSLAQRIQIKRPQHYSSARKGKNRLELFNNKLWANDQGKIALQLEKSVIQEESDKTSRSLSDIKFEKPEALHSSLNKGQSDRSALSNHPNSIILNSYTKLPSNADSPEHSPSKLNNFFRDQALPGSRVINFSSDPNLPVTEG